MQINNSTNVIKTNIERAQNNKFQKQKETYTQTKSGLLLPDIRGNQILLPDNKIYNSQGIKMQPFNERGLTVETPKNYKLVNGANDKVLCYAQLIFSEHDMSRYEDTKTGKHVLRAVKNNYSDEGVLNSTEIIEMDASATSPRTIEQLKKEVFENISLATKYIEDYEHNTVSEVKIKNPLAITPVTTSVTTLQKDQNGNVIKRMDYKKAPVKGLFDVYETDASGKTNVLSKTNVDKDGSYTVVKNLKSLDGTTTKYRFKSDKDGNHKAMFCQIRDKNGKVLSTIDRTYDKANKDLVYSSVNGNKYKAERRNTDITITNLTSGKVTKMNSVQKMATPETRCQLMMGGLVKGTQLSNENVVDNLFNTMPADALLTLNSNISQIIPMKDDLDSMFVQVFDFLLCSKDNFAIMHELGHSKDASRVPDEEKTTDFEIFKKYDMHNISGQKDFYKAYLEEKADFIKTFPDYTKNFVDYFIKTPENRPFQGRGEVVAETNAMNGLDPAGLDMLGMRTTLLQQYFPRTIAEATKRMNSLATKDAGTKSQAE